MRNVTWRVLALVFLFAALPVWGEGEEFMRCDECDEYMSVCSTRCWYCDGTDYEDGSCDPWDRVTTNCGEYVGACRTSYDCWPNWVETGRQNVGTYGESTFYWVCQWGGSCWLEKGCDHHRVDIVTLTDTNQCNANPYFNTRETCDDWVDGSKEPNSWYNAPDCCEPYVCATYPDPRCYYDPRFTCNNYHSCWWY